MAEKTNSNWNIVVGFILGTIFTGAVNFATDYFADQRDLRQDRAADRANIRESYLSEIEEVFQDFDSTFQLFTRELIDTNTIEPAVRQELLQDLQQLTNNVISLNNALGETLEISDRARLYQDQINSTREELLTVSDAGEMKELYEAYGNLRVEQNKLFATIRSIPVEQ